MGDDGSINAVRELDDAIHRLDREMEGRSDGELAASLIEASRRLDRLRSVVVRGLSRLEKAEAYRDDGSTNLVQWLKVKCRMSPGAACEMATLAQNLDELEATSEALHDGSIGFDHAVAIGRAATRVGVEKIKKEEAKLLEVARGVDPGTLAREARELRYRIDADGELERANQIFERRYHRLAGRALARAAPPLLPSLT